MAESKVRVWPVGGVVRDFLLGRTPSDLDLVVDLRRSEDVREYVQRLAQRMDGTLVKLDGKRGYWRIAGIPQGHLDFAALQADTIEADLTTRDFTMNSIAWDLNTNDFIDPLSGVEDCLTGVLRADSELVLGADPLRNLRAWRFLCGGMRPSPELERQVRKHAPRLAKVAAERLNEELGRIFKEDIVGTWEFARATGLLKVLWPGSRGREDVALARLRSWQAWRETQTVLTASSSEAVREGERRYWSEEVRAERSRFQFLGLAMLIGLELEVNPEAVAIRFALGRHELQLLTLMLKEGKAASQLMRTTASAGEWHDFFRRCGAESLGVLGYAALAFGEEYTAACGDMVADWLNRGVVSAPRLEVTTKQLLQRFPQVAGRQIGDLLRHLERLCAERGGLSAADTFGEAERWLRE